MRLNHSIIVIAFFSISVITNAQIKLHTSGGISIGSTTDPTNIIKLDKATTFAQSATFSSTSTFNGNSTFSQPISFNAVSTFTQPATFYGTVGYYGTTTYYNPATFTNSATFGNDVTFGDDVTFGGDITFNGGTNLFEKYNAGGGLTVLGSAGTISMYGDQGYYRIGTSLNTISFEDPVRFNDGFSVSVAGNTDFYSESTFRDDVDFGLYGTVNLTTFYGSALFESANLAASFTCNQHAVFNQSLTVATLIQQSDKFLKRNIEDLSAGSLDKVLRLRGVTYNYLSDSKDEPPRAGFIAQDLQAILPDLVVENENGLAINPLELLPYLVEAIKEQDQRIKYLESKLEDKVVLE